MSATGMTGAWRRLGTVERVAWVLALLSIVALAVVVRKGHHAGSAPLPSSAATEVRTCKAVSVPARPVTPVTCRTASATLTFAATGTAAAVGSTALQVLRATRDGTHVTITARVGNASAEDRSLDAGSTRVYINASGNRHLLESSAPLRVAAGSSPTLRLHFSLPRSARSPQLALVAWQEPGIQDRELLIVPLATIAAANLRKPRQ